MYKSAIAIFAYNRPSHLKRLLIALENYQIKFIDVFIDGPKNKKDKLIQDEILFMLKNNSKIDINIIYRKKNLGLAKSLILGIDYMSNKYDHFIILEDDVIPYKNFFKFMKLNLKKYQNNNEISAICAYQFPEFNLIKENKNISLINDYFIPWGWATWSSKWKEYKSFKVSEEKLKKIKGKTIFKFFFNKLKTKKNSIWTASYVIFCLLKKKKFIYPLFSLTKNIGFDGSGVNSKISNKLRVFEKKNLENYFHYSNDSKYKLKFSKIFKSRLKLFY